jgi:hypothetical protein
VAVDRSLDGCPDEREMARWFGPSTRAIDLGGRTVIPAGFTTYPMTFLRVLSRGASRGFGNRNCIDGP